MNKDDFAQVAFNSGATTAYRDPYDDVYIAKFQVKDKAWTFAQTCKDNNNVTWVKVQQLMAVVRFSQ